MGADQVGYLVKGPVKIGAGKIKAAVRACRCLRRELLADAGEDATPEERSDAAESATGEFFDPVDIQEQPESIIREFVDWWHNLDSRDACGRQDPDDPRQKLVYAGELSWGDEPDGYGFQIIKKALVWGF